jgi:hypothetical protein
MPELPEPEQKPGKPKAERPARAEPIYDARCANVFPNEHQAAAFHEAVTTPLARDFLPVKNQLPLAKEMMTELSALVKSGHRVGAPWIKGYLADKLNTMSGIKRKFSEQEKREMEAKQNEQTLKAYLATFTSSLRGVVSAGHKIGELVKKHPDLKKSSAFLRLHTPLEQARNIINNLYKAL